MNHAITTVGCCCHMSQLGPRVFSERMRLGVHESRLADSETAPCNRLGSDESVSECLL